MPKKSLLKYLNSKLQDICMNFNLCELNALVCKEEINYNNINYIFHKCCIYGIIEIVYPLLLHFSEVIFIDNQLLLDCCFLGEDNNYEVLKLLLKKVCFDDKIINRSFLILCSKEKINSVETFLNLEDIKNKIDILYGFKVCIHFNLLGMAQFLKSLNPEFNISKNKKCLIEHCLKNCERKNFVLWIKKEIQLNN